MLYTEEFIRVQSGEPFTFKDYVPHMSTSPSTLLGVSVTNAKDYAMQGVIVDPNPEPLFLRMAGDSITAIKFRIKARIRTKDLMPNLRLMEIDPFLAVFTMCDRIILWSNENNGEVNRCGEYLFLNPTCNLLEKDYKIKPVFLIAQT
jgi:hypothetical protein